MSFKQFLQVWGIVDDDEPSPVEMPRYSREHQDWYNEQIDQMVEASTNSPQQSDEYYRACQERIEEMPENQRYEAYELLLGYISNNHPYGFAAPIYDEIAEHANRNAVRE